MRNGNSHEIVVVTKELKTEKPVDWTISVLYVF